VRKTKLLGHLRGPLVLRRYVQQVLNMHVEAISREAQRSWQLVKLALLLWWDDGRWKEQGKPAPSLTEKNPMTGGYNHGFYSFFARALTVGRLGSDPRFPDRGEPNEYIDAAYRRLGSPVRLPRLAGDSQMLTNYERTKMQDAFLLHVGAGAPHGLVPRLKRYLRAAFLRGLEQHLAAPGGGAPDTLGHLQRLLTASRSKRLTAIVDALFYLVAGISVRIKADDSLVQLNPEEQLLRVLGVEDLPAFVSHLIHEVQGWLQLGDEEAGDGAAAAAAAGAGGGVQRPPQRAAAAAAEQHLLELAGFDDDDDHDEDYVDEEEVDEDEHGHPRRGKPIVAGSLRAFSHHLRSNPVEASINCMLHMLQRQEAWIKELQDTNPGRYRRLCSSGSAEDQMAAVGGYREEALEAALPEQQEELDGVDHEGDDQGEDDDDDNVADGAELVGGSFPQRSGFFYPKLFNLVPTSAARRRHVRFDGDALFNIFGPATLPGEDNLQGRPLPPEVVDLRKSIRKLRRGRPLHPLQILHRVFDLPLPPEDHAFGSSVETDGHSLSAQYVANAEKEDIRLQRVMGLLPPSTKPLHPPPGQRRHRPPGPRRPPHGLACTHPRRGTGTLPPACLHQPYLRVIGVDPGRINLVTAVEVLPFADASGQPCIRTWNLTRKRWRSDIGAQRREDDARAWTTALRHVPSAAAAAAGGDHAFPSPAGAFVQLAAPEACGKTASLDQYLQHMRLTARLRPVIFAETLKPRWANADFRAYQAKCRALAQFWSEVRAGKLEDGTAGVHPVIAYGDANFASSYRGGISAPTTAAYVACVNVMGQDAVCLTSEYRSTKCHAACGSPLRKVTSEVPSYRHQKRMDKYERVMKAWTKDVHEATACGRALPARPWVRKPPEVRRVDGLRVCVNPDCPERHRSLVHRDVNAALNIRLAFLQLDRGESPPRHLDPRYKQVLRLEDEVELERRANASPPLNTPWRIHHQEGTRHAYEHLKPHGDGLRQKLCRDLWQGGRRDERRECDVGGMLGDVAAYGAWLRFGDLSAARGLAGAPSEPLAVSQTTAWERRWEGGIFFV